MDARRRQAHDREAHPQAVMPAPLPLTFDAARARIQAAVAAARPLAHERVALADAIGRVLAADLIAAHALPPFRNSAMDGFAVRSADLAHATPDAPVTLRVTSVLAAGEARSHTLTSGTAARIMTGAPLPQGCDAIVPFEDAERSGHGDAERCLVRHAVRAGDHVREAGADLAAGARALTAGTRLNARQLALAASLGAATLAVSARPRVTVLSTGDELIEPSEPLRPGAIRDSNRLMLAQLCAEAGADVVHTARLPDDAERVTHAIRLALATSDVVFTIGGVSAGDFDPVKQALDTLEDIELWRVAMRPGRPQAFGLVEGVLCFGLPGNPASVTCVFETLARPALLALQGAARVERARVPVRSGERLASRAGRTDFVRCTLAWHDGALIATSAGAQVSGHLTPQAHAHALLIVPEELESLESGAVAEAFVWELP